MTTPTTYMKTCNALRHMHYTPLYQCFRFLSSSVSSPISDSQTFLASVLFPIDDIYFIRSRDTTNQTYAAHAPESLFTLPFPARDRTPPPIVALFFSPPLSPFLSWLSYFFSPCLLIKYLAGERALFFFSFFFLFFSCFSSFQFLICVDFPLSLCLAFLSFFISAAQILVSLLLLSKALLRGSAGWYRMGLWGAWRILAVFGFCFVGVVQGGWATGTHILTLTCHTLSLNVSFFCIKLTRCYGENWGAGAWEGSTAVRAVSCVKEIQSRFGKPVRHTLTHIAYNLHRLGFADIGTGFGKHWDGKGPCISVA
jgi:hypothetical protein